MNRTFKIYLVIFAVVIALIALLEFNKSELIDWRKTLDPNGKEPFGLFIFNQEADNLLHNKLEKTTQSPYELFSEDSLQAPQNLLLINYYPTTEGWEKILARVKKGDNLMVIAQDVDYYLADTLKFNHYRMRYESDNKLVLTDQKFVADSIYIDKIAGNNSIDRIDTLTTRILGKNWEYDKEYVANFIEIKHGKGKVFIHLEPMMLTNYYLLQEDDYKYVEHVFSYLPDQKTLWFQPEYEFVNTSPLRFVLENDALRYAWYIFLLGMLLFAIFHAKRRQRTVPIIEPLKNSSAEFVKTIGNLYLQEGNSKDMAQKKATYFLNKVRTDLLIDTHDLDDVFVHRLQLKTGAKKENIQKAIPLLKKALHEQAPIQESELLALNKLLDQFYK